MKLTTISALTLLLTLASCVKETGNDPIKEMPQAKVEFVSIDNVTSTSAILKGQAQFPEDLDNRMYILGALYFEDGSTILESKEDFATTISTDGTFEIKLTSLQPGTDYRCILEILNVLNSSHVYSEEVPFSTKSIYKLISTGIADNISTSGATLNARLDLSGNPSSDVKYGFKWGIDKEKLDQSIVSDNLAEGAFSAKLSELSLNTEYYFRAYVTLDGETLQGDIVKFSTSDDISVIVTDFDRVSAIGVQIKGQFYLPKDIKAGNAEYGVAYLTSPIFDIENATVAPAQARDEGNNFVVSIFGLDPETTYYCFAYVYLTDSKTFTVGEQSIKIKTSQLSEMIDPESFSKNVTDVTLKGHLYIPDNFPQPEEYGFVLSREDGTEMIIKMPSYDKSNSTIEATARNLMLDTKYSFRVYVKFPFRMYKSENFIEFMLSSIEDIRFERKAILLYPGESGIRLQPVIKPENAPDKRLRWTSMNPGVVEVDDSGRINAKKAGSADVTAIALVGGKTATFTVVVDDGVDMGNGLLWSNYNAGASAVEAYGEYFQFGKGPMSRVWRLPTDDEMNKMLQSTNHTVEWRGSSKGIRFDSKVTSGSIFLPGGGYKTGSGILYLTNVYGYYWTSVDCRCLDFFLNALTIRLGREESSYQLPIRLVRNK